MKQIHGSVPSEVADMIQQEAEREIRSLNNFVGVLIRKGWEKYQEEKNG